MRFHRAPYWQLERCCCESFTYEDDLNFYMRYVVLLADRKSKYDMLFFSKVYFGEMSPLIVCIVLGRN